MGFLDKLGGLGGVAGAGLQIASGIFGAVQGRKSAKKANKMIAGQKSKNESWYQKNYNEKYTQRADVVDALQQTSKLLSERTKRTAATGTVMGGTDEAIAMDKQGANQAVADATAQISAQGAAHKDNIDQQYRAVDDSLTQQQVQVEMQKGQNIAKAASGASAGAAGIAGSIFEKPKKPEE